MIYALLLEIFFEKLVKVCSKDQWSCLLRERQIDDDFLNLVYSHVSLQGIYELLLSLPEYYQIGKAGE